MDISLFIFYLVWILYPNYSASYVVKIASEDKFKIIEIVYFSLEADNLDNLNNFDLVQI